MKSVTACLALLGATDAYTLAGGRIHRGARAEVSMMADRKSPDSTDWSMVPAEELVPLEPSWNDPREGEPFGKGDRDEKTGYRQVGGVRVAVEAYQPRGISDATVIKAQYIETEDEPWHADNRMKVRLTKGELEAGMTAMVPYIGAELDLEAALRAAEDGATVEAAVTKALAAGGRKGSPAFKTADKMLAAFAKGGDEAAAEAKKLKPKAPAKPKAQGSGWDDFERKAAKTHDNSVA